MTTQSITVRLPEKLYLRLQQAAQATRRPLQEILLRAVEIGSPPHWDDAPAPFQADLAALDRLDDEALWNIARAEEQVNRERYQELLDKNANETLSAAEREELERLRLESDRFMLRKAQAVALLRWRGHVIPQAKALNV